MSPLKINQSFEKRGLANLSSPELAMYSPKGSKPFHPRPPSCNRSDLFLEVCQGTRPKRDHGAFSAPTRPLGVGAFWCRCHHKQFITEASDTLRTNPVEPQYPMGYTMRMRGTETRELLDRYANMLSARRPYNNKRKFSSRTHIAALSNHSTPSDHAAENAELRQLLRDAKEPISSPDRARFLDPD